MSNCKFIFVLLILTLNEIKSDACKGCVELDELSFEKLIKAFPASVVKFDIAFPYGEKHEIFEKFSKDVSRSSEILVAQVGVKDYGEHDNEKLANKYNIKKEDFPVLLLFKNGDMDNPIKFSEGFTLNNIKRFFKTNSDVYLGAAGCIEVYDKLVVRFIKEKGKRSDLKKSADDLLEKQNPEDLQSAKIYIMIMEKVLKNGEVFVNLERERVNRLLQGKLSANKKEQLLQKLNILDSFSKISSRDEL